MARYFNLDYTALLWPTWGYAPSTILRLILRQNYYYRIVSLSILIKRLSSSLCPFPMFAFALLFRPHWNNSILSHSDFSDSNLPNGRLSLYGWPNTMKLTELQHDPTSSKSHINKNNYRKYLLRIVKRIMRILLIRYEFLSNL